MARADSKWMPLYIGDYLADTAHLSRAQHGSYLLLMMAYWRRGGPLPDNDALLAQIAKCSAKEWQADKPILSDLFKVGAGLWVQSRADKELAKASANHKAKQEAGARGGKAKAERQAQAKQTSSTATAKPLADDQRTPAPSPSHSADAEIPSSTDGVAVDPAKWVYDIGKNLLKTYGISPSKAGGLITKWRKALDDQQLLAVIAYAGQQKRHDIVAVIEGSIRTRTHGKSHDNSEQQRADREAILAAFGHSGMETTGPAPGELDPDDDGTRDSVGGSSPSAEQSQGRDGGDRQTPGVRAGVQSSNAGKIGGDRKLPRPAFELAGGSAGTRGDGNHRELAMGQSHADAVGHSGNGGGRTSSAPSAARPGANGAQETPNPDDELDLPPYLDRRKTAVG